MQRLLFTDDAQIFRLCLADPRGQGNVAGLRAVNLCTQPPIINNKLCPFCQQRCNLGFKTGHLGLKILNGGLLVLRLLRKRGDQRRLHVSGRGGICQFATQTVNFGFQLASFDLFKAQRFGQIGHLLGKVVQLCILRVDGFAQNKLHDHENRQNEHQHQQQRGHRIHKTGPDAGVKPLTASPGQGHCLSLSAPRVLAWLLWRFAVYGAD